MLSADAHIVEPEYVPVVMGKASPQSSFCGAVPAIMFIGVEDSSLPKLSVTVTKYSPGLETVIDGVVSPPGDQTLAVSELDVNVTGWPSQITGKPSIVMVGGSPPPPVCCENDDLDSKKERMEIVSKVHFIENVLSKIDWLK